MYGTCQTILGVFITYFFLSVEATFLMKNSCLSGNVTELEINNKTKWISTTEEGLVVLASKAQVYLQPNSLYKVRKRGSNVRIEGPVPEINKSTYNGVDHLVYQSGGASISCRSKKERAIQELGFNASIQTASTVGLATSPLLLKTASISTTTLPIMPRLFPDSNTTEEPQNPHTNPVPTDIFVVKELENSTGSEASVSLSPTSATKIMSDGRTDITTLASYDSFETDLSTLIPPKEASVTTSTKATTKDITDIITQMPSVLTNENETDAITATTEDITGIQTTQMFPVLTTDNETYPSPPQNISSNDSNKKPWMSKENKIYIAVGAVLIFVTLFTIMTICLVQRKRKRRQALRGTNEEFFITGNFHDALIRNPEGGHTNQARVRMYSEVEAETPKPQEIEERVLANIETNASLDTEKPRCLTDRSTVMMEDL